MPFPTQGDLPDSGIETASLMSPELAGGFFTTSATCIQHTHTHTHIWTSQVVLMVKYLLANAGDIRDAVSIPESGRSP